MTRRLLTALTFSLLVLVPSPAADAKHGGVNRLLLTVADSLASMQHRIYGIHFKLSEPYATWSGAPTVKGLQIVGVLWGKGVLNQDARPTSCGSHFAMTISMSAPQRFTVDLSAAVTPGHAKVYVRDVRGKKHTGKWKRLVFTVRGPRGPVRYRYASLAAYAAITDACVSRNWLNWDWSRLSDVTVKGVRLLHLRGVGSVGTVDLLVGAQDHFIYFEVRQSGYSRAQIAFAGFNRGIPYTVPPS